MVVRVHVGDSKAACGEIVEECKPRATAESATEQIVNLRSDRSWDYEIARLVSEQRFDRRT